MGCLQRTPSDGRPIQAGGEFREVVGQGLTPSSAPEATTSSTKTWVAGVVKFSLRCTVGFSILGQDCLKAEERNRGEDGEARQTPDFMASVNFTEKSEHYSNLNRENFRGSFLQ